MGHLARQLADTSAPAGPLVAQNDSLALRPATVSVTKFALPGSITCRSAVRMNRGVTANLS